MNEDSLSAAVAAGLLASSETHRDLLQSIVDVARAIFGSRAASILIYDEETDDLVFEAVSGEGGRELIGKRFPSSTGIAGWTLVTRQPLVVEDLHNDPRFARDVAAGTGYVPDAIMAVPLLREDRALGVLEVLDRPQREGFSLGEIDVLTLFADQAAIALALLDGAARARAVLAGDDDLALVARLAASLAGGNEGRRAEAMRLLSALEKLVQA